MKIVLFNRFFYPDASATSQIASDLAFALAAHGFEVHVIASRSDVALAPTEKENSVTIHRVGKASKPSSLTLKAVDYARYYFGARHAAKRVLKRGDVAIVMTDPPMLAAVIGPVAIGRDAVMVSWLQDVFPEIAIEYGIRGAGFWLIRHLRNRWLRRSQRCIAISNAMKAKIISEAALPLNDVVVIHNWARGNDIRPIDPSTSPLRHEWDLDHAFVVGYSGNLGRVHEFETILEAAALLSEQSNIQFVIIGTGPQLIAVRSRAKAMGLSNIQFRPPQMRTSLTESLGLPDVHLCVLRPEFEALVVPSKVYGILAAARPQIYIGDPGAEIAHLLGHEGAGIAVMTGDAKGLADAICRLQSEPVIRSDMGRNARALFEREFDFPIALGKFEALLSELPLKHSDPE